MQNNQQPETDGILPKGFKVLIGVLLLVVSVGCMSLWGVFA